MATFVKSVSERVRMDNRMALAYEKLDPRAQTLFRHELSSRLMGRYLDSERSVIPTVQRLFGCRNIGIARVFTGIIREMLIQPMASSWSLVRNMQSKYGVSITVPELREYYQVIQKSKIVQDMIRYNSSATKVIAVARGVLSTTLGTTYYLDIQTTDACPNLCRKCWRFYEDEEGRPRLVVRKSPEGLARVRPDFEHFKSVVREAVDLGTEQLSSTGGGEPMMNRRLPELFEFAKEYARSLGRDIKTFIPTSGLGVVFNDPVALRRIVRNINNLRFSVDSFDRDFVLRHHGINPSQYDELLENIRRTVAMKKEEGSDIQIEILILMYEGTYKTMEQTIATARELGATRILINSTVDKPEFKGTSADQDAALSRVAEKAARGDYGDLVVEIDPLLQMSSFRDMQPIDLALVEPALGRFGACMKNVVGLTPVITADGTFHVCFPCSQPPVANKGGVFKIGNIMKDPFLRLMERMKNEYRGIDVERDCSPDCRDILYFNAIIRKVIEDWIFGIPLRDQPFLDRTTVLGTTRNPMHQEGFNVQTAAEERIRIAGESVLRDKVQGFKDVSGYLEAIPLKTFADMLEPGVPVKLLDKYETDNLFDVNLFSDGRDVYAFSFDIGVIYRIGTGESYKFGASLPGSTESASKLFGDFHRIKESGEIYLPNNNAGQFTLQMEDLRRELRKQMLLGKYNEWPSELVAKAYDYYLVAKISESPPAGELGAVNGITLLSRLERDGAKSPEVKKALLHKLHAYLFQLAATREFCRDFVIIYNILSQNDFI